MKLRRRHKNASFCWCPAHVGIPGNKAADTATVAAIDSIMEVNNEEIPCRDWYPKVKKALNEQWHNAQHNKLRLIKDSISAWPSSSCTDRKTSIILTRLRIGHTKATHQYLMERLYQPYCEDSLVPLTFKHFLAECPSHNLSLIHI